jgi:5,10-methylene-tetrahydrofolate dehydrogenase/methenyl tetrahydrofolate cyclohydrolase
MTAHMIDGHVLAAKLLSRARTISRQLARKPRLAVVSGADAAARSYLKALLTAGPLAGVDVVIHRLHGGSRACSID